VKNPIKTWLKSNREISQENLAAACGTTLSKINRLCNDRETNLGVVMLRKIWTTTGIKLESLVNYFADVTERREK